MQNVPQIFETPNITKDIVSEPPAIFDTPEVKQKNNYSLLYNGKNLIILDDENNIVKSYSAFSGKNDKVKGNDGLDTDEVYMNNPKYQNLKGLGPTPEGEYRLGLLDENLATKGNAKQYSQTMGGNPLGNLLQSILEAKLSPNKFYSSASGWGNYRLPLIPLKDTNTFGRSGMFLHGGSTPGSSGCIDLTDNIDNVVDFFKSKNINMENLLLKVKYDSEK